MDPGFRSLFLDALRSGEPSDEVRRAAARGACAPTAVDQLGALVWLSDDDDPSISAMARQTIDGLPQAPLRAFLGRADTPEPLRTFFAARGLSPAPDDAPGVGPDPFPVHDPVPELPGVPNPADVPAGADEAAAPERRTVMQRIAAMSVPERLALATRGSREVRAILVRDPNKLVTTAVIASPKLTESEVESISRMTNVAEEILRIIATNRSWTKNYAVVAALTKNPKTPVTLSMTLLARLNDRDLKGLAANRNVPDVLRMNARKRLSPERA